MCKDRYNLLVAAREVLADFDTFGEVLQVDEAGDYGSTTAIELLRAAVADLPDSLCDRFGPMSAGTPSESIDACVRLHLDHHNQFPMFEIYSRRDDSGNAIDDDKTLADIAKRIAANWNHNVL